MPRGRRSARGSGQNYSSETSASSIAIPGVRKVKNFQIDASIEWVIAAGGFGQTHGMWALIE
jgi:hypothetical protein